MERNGAGSVRLRKCAFVDVPTVAGRQAHFGEGVTPEEMQSFSWLKPNIQASVAFNEWTRAGALRRAELLRLL